MTDARSIPEAVLWHEGMLLSPQHFQQADLRSHALRSYLIGAIAPFGWGVRRLRIDSAALEAGRLYVTELETIMPDGLLVTHPPAADETQPVLELDLKPLLADGASKSITVHVAVALPMTGQNGAGKRHRFRQVVGDEVADANTGDSRIVIPRLLPNPCLEPTDAPSNPPSPAHLVSLPLTVLESNGQRFTRSADYEPPRLFVEEGNRLFDCAKTIENALAVKANDWAGRLRGALAEGQAATVHESTIALRTIVRGVPRLTALLKTQLAHPFEVYLAMCDIAGDLSVIGGELTNPDFGVYNHFDPLKAFVTAARFITEALNKLRTPYTTEPFDRVEAGQFELTLRPEYLRDPQVIQYLRDKVVVGIHMKRTQSVEAVRQWFRAARIGAKDDILKLDLNRSVGAAREEIQSAPDLGVSPQLQTLLFSVSADPDLLAGGHALHISLRPDEAPTGDEETGSSEPDQIMLFLPLPDPNSPTAGSRPDDASSGKVV